MLDFSFKIRSFAAVLALFWRLDVSLCSRHHTFWSQTRERLFGIHQLTSRSLFSLRAGQTNISSTTLLEEDVSTEELSSLDDSNSSTTFTTWSDKVAQPFVENDSSSLTFSVVKDGDGSQDDPDGIPTRFLIAHKQNREKALAAFQHTCEWRNEHEIDTILTRPQPNFDICREIFPIYLPGKDSEGHLIIVQRPGMVDLEKSHDHNISHDEILMHYLYLVEYAWNLLDPSPLPPDGLMTTILDCQGVRFGMFQDKEFRTFGSKLVKIMSDHYPTRSHKTLIVHAPKWIKLAFNLVKPLMRESTRKKIMILNTGPQQDRILKEVLGTVPAYLLSEKKDGKEDANSILVEEPPSEIEQELRLVARVGLGKTNVETPTALS